MNIARVRNVLLLRVVPLAEDLLQHDLLDDPLAVDVLLDRQRHGDRVALLGLEVLQAVAEPRRARCGTAAW